MKINRYDIFGKENKSILSSHFLPLQATVLLLLMFLFNTSIFGQTAPEKLEEAIKPKVIQKEKSSDKMTVNKMHEILKSESKKIAGQIGNWQLEYKGLPFLVITDERANRMRIISPIIEDKKLTSADLVKLMEANFSSALDAKYSIYQKILWSSFAHPLGELSEAQFKDALDQVFNLVKNYGTTYSSTGVVFGETQEPEKEVIN